MGSQAHQPDVRIMDRIVHLLLLRTGWRVQKAHHLRAVVGHGVDETSLETRHPDLGTILNTRHMVMKAEFHWREFKNIGCMRCDATAKVIWWGRGVLAATACLNSPGAALAKRTVATTRP